MARTSPQPDDRRSSANDHLDATGADLLPRIRAGDEAAFAALFELYVVPLCVFVLPYVQSREVAADVVHDVFLRIWQRREQLEVHGSLRAYLYRATRNHALNLLRRHALEQRWKDEALQEELGATPPVDQAFERAELRAELERVTAELPERCRMVFLLRWRDGLRNAEIAEVMGIAVKTVETQITRALRTMRARLGEHHA